MEFGHYGDETVELALELANTRPTELFPDELPDVASLEGLLDRYDIAPPPGGVSAADLAEVHALREELVSVLEADDVADAAPVLNEVMRRCGAVPHLTDHDHRSWHLHFEPADDRLASRLGAVCAPTLALLLREVGLDRVGECHDATCESFYVDASRNAARLYCSHRCATRSSVAAYRQRKRAAGAPDPGRAGGSASPDPGRAGGSAGSAD